MNRQTLSLLLVLGLLVSGQAFGQTASAAEPAQPQSLAGTKLLYKIFKTVVVDIDAELKKQQIEIVSCSLVSAKKQKTFNYPGLGPCLFGELRDAMSGKYGVVYAWGKTPFGELKPLRIEWHPTTTGWWSIYKVYREFQNEDKAVQKKSSGVSATNSLIGELRLFFPADFPIRQLAIVTEPAQRKDGIIENQGTLQLILNRTMMAGRPLDFVWSTNINPVKLDRHFYFRSNGAPLIGEELP